MKRSMLFYSSLIVLTSFIGCSNPSNMESKPVTKPTQTTTESDKETSEEKTESKPSKQDKPQEQTQDKTQEQKQEEEKSEIEELGVSIETTENLFNKLKDKTWTLKQEKTSGKTLFSNVTFSNNIQGIITGHTQNKEVHIGISKVNVICYVDGPFINILEKNLMGGTIIDRGSYFEFVNANKETKAFILDEQYLHQEFTDNVNKNLETILKSNWTEKDDNNKIVEDGLKISFKYDKGDNVLKTKVKQKATNEHYMKIQALLDNKEFLVEHVKKDSIDNLDIRLILDSKTYELALNHDRLVLAEVKPTTKTLAVFGRS